MPRDTEQAIVIDPRDRRPLPRVLRPSAQIAFATRSAQQHFLRSAPEFGCVRASYGWPLQNSATPEEFFERLRVAHQEELLPFVSRGALVLATIWGTPRWLSPRPWEAVADPPYYHPRYSTYPPTDPAAYAALLVKAAQIGGPRVVLELGSELESSHLWRGTEEQLLDLLMRCARAVRATGRDVVGIGSGGPGSRLLQLCIRRRMPFTGLTWHCFQKNPSDGLAEGAAYVRALCLAEDEAGELPQYVTEWQRWVTYPARLDPSRDEEVCAAHHAAALHTMARAGVAGATVATLEGYERGAPLGLGSFGLLAHDSGGLVEKPAFRLQRLLGQLGTVQYGVAVPPQLEGAGVGCVATDRGSLIYRYDPQGSAPLRVPLQRRGLAALSMYMAPYSVALIEV